MHSPNFMTDVKIVGKNLVLRSVVPADAEFILSLRLDENKNRHISFTSPDVDKQKEWIRRSQNDREQSYLLIEDRLGKRLGTVRLYGPRDSAFCWGSWILSDERPASAAVESTVMVYMYGLFCGFQSSYFEVRRENTKVWQYHERMGAVRVGEHGDDLFYEIDNSAIINMLMRYRERIDGKISIHSMDQEKSNLVTIESLRDVVYNVEPPHKAEVFPESAQDSIVPGVKLMTLRVAQDQRGKLTVAEYGGQLPFVPHRIFMVHDVPSRESRGEHAHRECHQLLICVRGELVAVVDDGRNREEFVLDTPDKALYMPPRIWGTQYRYSSDALLVVLASHPYDSSDYVRDYQEFVTMVKSDAW